MKKTGALIGSEAFGNVPIALRVRGSLSTARLEQAFLDVVGRHAVLRSRFLVVDGIPVQVPWAVPGRALQVIDFTQVSPTRVEVAARERLEALAAAPLDLSRLPWRLEVLRLGPGDHVVLIVLHHLVADGYGIRLLLGELGEHYKARTTGHPPDVPALGLQVADLAVRERDTVGGADSRVHLDYWDRVLDGACALTFRPTIPVRRPDYVTAGVPVRLSSQEAEDLRELGRRERVTPFMILTAAFQAALHLQSGEDEFVIGTIISHRPSLDAEKLVGNFGNNVFLTGSFADRPTFRELLARTRDTILDAHAHATLPLEKLVEVRGITLPRFNVMIVLRGSSLAVNFDPPDLQAEAFSLGGGMSPLDLQLDLTDGATGIRGELEYRTSVMTEGGARSIVGHLMRVLELGLGDPDRPLPEPGRRPPWREPDETGAPRPGAAPQALDAPRTETERCIAAIWGEILSTDVTLSDNFFELGGHSLLALAVLERIHQATGRNLTVIDLGMQTLAQLASQVDES